MTVRVGLATVILTARLVFAPDAILAQERAAGSGSIVGRVVDQRTGSTVVGADVELVLARGETFTTRTDGAGSFRFSDVPSGEHVLRIRHRVYDLVVRAIRVSGGVASDVRIEVTPSAFPLDTLRVIMAPLSARAGQTEFGVRIEARALRLLPTPYDPEAAATLAAGVSADRIWGGAARDANLYQLDGSSLTHPGTGGFTMPISPAWVEAVEVRGLGAGAELGNFQGGVLNIVTRSGTNDWRSRARSSLEAHPLNASNLVSGEIGRERSMRSEIEAEIGGPLSSGKLFLFAAGHVLRETVRAQTRIAAHAEHPFLAGEEERSELRGFGKLTWLASDRTRFDAAGALNGLTGKNWGLTGYEGAGAAPDYRGPSNLWLLSMTTGLGGGSLDVRASGASSRQRVLPAAGANVPAVRFFAYGDPPSPVYNNAPFELERSPSTMALAATYGHALRIAGIGHDVEAGIEWLRGSWVDRRSRTGGVTWRAARSPQFDRTVPATWFTGNRLSSDWGGEVDLNARTSAQAVFVQDHIALHPRARLNAGVRWGRWRGDLLPGGRAQDRFTALESDAWDPRIGIVIDPFGREDLLLKVHWGRYHQNLLTGFFDRTDGGAVFSNRESWQYLGSPFADPATTFSPAQRDAMNSGSPQFTRQEIIRLNETGPVAANYRQPYVDQWIAGIEKSIGGSIRLEALFVDRRNRDMVALMDRNLDDNYVRYTNVHVRTLEGGEIRFGDGPMVLPALYIPKYSIKRQLEHIAMQAMVPPPPGFTVADIPTLTFEQDLIIDNVPGAYRHSRQVHLSAHIAKAAWGASLSAVLSRLTGNLDSVTGYEAGTGYERFWELGAGPFVRPNEQVNFDGRLAGVSPIEVKVAVYGELPGAFRGGAFLHAARGERFTPYFTLTGLSNRYFVDGLEIDNAMVHDVAGQRVFVRARGTARYGDRFTLDLHLERAIPLLTARWRTTLDVFNLWNASAPTRINASLTYPSAQIPGTFATVDESAVFRSVWERVPPRTLRLGITVDF